MSDLKDSRCSGSDEVKPSKEEIDHPIDHDSNNEGYQSESDKHKRLDKRVIAGCVAAVAVAVIGLSFAFMPHGTGNDGPKKTDHAAYLDKGSSDDTDQVTDDADDKSADPDTGDAATDETKTPDGGATTDTGDKTSDKSDSKKDGGKSSGGGSSTNGGGGDASGGGSTPTPAPKKKVPIYKHHDRIPAVTHQEKNYINKQIPCWTFAADGYKCYSEAEVDAHCDYLHSKGLTTQYSVSFENKQVWDGTYRTVIDSPEVPAWDEIVGYKWE